MAGRRGYRSRRRKSVSRLYFLVGLFLVFVIFKWGFAFLIRVIGQTGGGGAQSTSVEDLVAPQAPVISALPEATNSGQLKVEGYTEAEVEVEYFINGRRIISELTNNIGFYQVTLDLEEGENLIKVVAKDEAENESTSKQVMVVYDFKAPEITVESPTESQEFFGLQQQTVVVTGEVSEPEADLRVNNTFTRLDSYGVFSLKLKLSEGDNEIKITATDLAGNVGEKVIKVKYAR